jgi:hypothetical protein
LPYKTLIMALGCGLAGALAAAAPTLRGTSQLSANTASSDYLLSDAVLEKMRQDLDVGPQRRHVWDVIGYFTQPIVENDRSEPLFETWHGENELFGSTEPETLRPGIRGFSRAIQEAHGDGAQSDIPVVSYTLYNEPAYEHIQRYQLNETSGLNELLKSGARDLVVAGDVTVPAFPIRSIVLKTVWWPVAQDKITALPVWDPELNPPNPLGNPYTGWSRVVAVDPKENTLGGTTTPVDFAGRSFARAKRVGVNAFYHVIVDARTAQSMMLDAETRRAILIALGRPLKAGDYIVLVSANFMTREISSWIWATFWWHDQPEAGPFSADRPATLQREWRNYLMQAAFDSEAPTARDGGPLVCFNPWLEGRFPDGGHGSGMSSNCMACHQRASYPQVSFLPVTRGAPDVRNDKAYADGRLRTSFLWSLVLHARH